MQSYDFSGKKEAKKIQGCIAYIFNNPVAGRLERHAWESR